MRDPMDATLCLVRACGRQTEWGSTLPLEVHAPWFLKSIDERPDLTLDEIVTAVHRHGIAGSRGCRVAVLRPTQDQR